MRRVCALVNGNAFSETAQKLQRGRGVIRLNPLCGRRDRDAQLVGVSAGAWLVPSSLLAWLLAVPRNDCQSRHLSSSPSWEKFVHEEFGVLRQEFQSARTLTEADARGDARGCGAARGVQRVLAVPGVQAVGSIVTPPSPGSLPGYSALIIWKRGPSAT